MRKPSSAEARQRALRSLKELTAAEDAAITKAARADPDARELTPAWFARARRGRPVSEWRKVSVTIRLDPDVVAALKADGPGWQTRLNERLARWLRRRHRTVRSAAT